ncbi:MAG: cyclic nucleotide-binding domain-containing protein [Sandaracinaceae bacterium]|nr:cyclic nucleotide-binding domain-containing protein [Sandaracinaceae bacterium]
MRPLPMEGGMLETVVRALSKSDLFAALKPEQLRKVAQRGELLQLSEGELIIREGDPSGAFFLILNGTAAVRAKDNEVTDLGSSDVIGEMGVLLGKPRTASVTATGPMIVLRYDAVVFDAMFERIPGFGMGICRALAGRLEHTTHKHFT